MRRRKLLVALVGLAVVATAGVVVLWPRPERVTKENYDRMHVGMTRTEVEAILGPPGDYRSGLGETGYGSTENMVWTPDPATELVRTLPNWSRIPDDQRLWASWLGDSFGIGIAVDESGSVADKVGCPRRTTRGLLDNLLWRLKRQWHRWFP
jgi:hypothetical protein